MKFRLFQEKLSSSGKSFLLHVHVYHTVCWYKHMYCLYTCISLYVDMLFIYYICILFMYVSGRDWCLGRLGLEFYYDRAGLFSNS